MTVVLLLFPLLFLAVRLAITLYNYFSRSYLPIVRRLDNPPFVSLLIIGDNDTPRMLYLIDLLKRIPYMNMEILVGVYNPIQKSLAKIRESLLFDKRFHLIEIESVKKDWRHENFINYTLGNKAKGNYLLFMDPDLELQNGILEILISYMRQQRLGLISVAPTHDLHTRAEWATLPIMNQLYLTIYPLGLVKKLSSLFAIASREFMLFEGTVYRSFQPFDETRIRCGGAENIAHYLKSESIRIDCLIGDKRVRLLGSVTWRRCFAQLVSELTPLIENYHIGALLYSSILMLWWIPFFLLEHFALFGIGIIEILVTQILISSITRINWKKSVVYYFQQTTVLFLAVWLSWRHSHHRHRKCRCLIV